MINKLEIIVRITEEGSVTENSLLTWMNSDSAAHLGSKFLSHQYLDLKIFFDQRRVLRNGEEVILSKYEYGILSFMAQHPGRIFSKEELFEAVWEKDSDSCLSAVTNTIGRIRRKIEADKNKPVYIQTVSNQGYVFAAEKPSEDF